MSDKARAMQFKCDTCNKVFIWLHHLRMHIKTHVENKVCQICDKNFVYQHSLQKHLLSHNKGKQYACELCDKSFICLAHYKRHKVVHTGDLHYKCYQCEQYFSHSSDRLRHLRLRYGIESSHTCGICKKKLASTWNLKTHMRLHMKHTPHGCEMCSLHFSNLSLLREHMSNHDTDKQKSLAMVAQKGVDIFSCPFCGRMFRNVLDLKRHREVYSGNESRYCTVCCKLYSSNIDLRSHMFDLHSGYRSLTCSVCSTEFTNPSDLIGHLLHIQN